MSCSVRSRGHQSERNLLKIQAKSNGPNLALKSTEGETMRTATVTVALIALAVGSLGAQGRRNSQGIPPGHLPPAGLCRGWYDDVPPGRQPGPRDDLTIVAL